MGPSAFVGQEWQSFKDCHSFLLKVAGDQRLDRSLVEQGMVRALEAGPAIEPRQDIRPQEMGRFVGHERGV